MERTRGDSRVSSCPARTRLSSRVRNAVLLLLLPVAYGAEFRHPGMLHTLDDLNRMRAMVAQGTEPWKSGFEKLKAHPQSQSSYVMQGPFEEISRNPTVHQREFDQDANAAYQCAMVWYITGDAAFARKSQQIVDGWSSTLKRVGGRDAVLAASISPFKLINAAEILRSTNSGWPAASARRAGQMFASVIYPVIENFALFANGNWDTGCIKTMMAIAVFRNDPEMFERALRYYVHGDGDGRLTHYIYESGQCQESGRDQGHTQLGLGHLADAAEIAWNQGLDLYSYADNRLLKGFEYTARYNLGEEVPFAPDIDQTGKYAHRQISRRGPFRPIYEEILNHYVNRVGVAALYVRRVVEQIRPEGAAFGADHPGFGTILFARAVGKDAWLGAAAAPGGVVATGASGGITLSWIPSRGVTQYEVKREGATIARGVTSTTYTDRGVKAGNVYRYVVTAVNDSVEVSAGAGLPAGWSADGPAQFDGRAFRVEGFAYRKVDGDGVLTARFVPQVASAFVRLGLRMGEVALMIAPGQNWMVGLVGQPGTALGAPYTSEGRLMQPCWLRLARVRDRFTGSISPDGQKWTVVGEMKASLPRSLVAGMAVRPGIPKVTTAVEFDNVVVTSRPRALLRSQ